MTISCTATFGKPLLNGCQLDPLLNETYNPLSVPTYNTFEFSVSSLITFTA